MKKICCVMSFDFLDRDVWLNVDWFYRSAGYQVRTNRYTRNADLLVILRGHPDAGVRGHRGIVHVYDYVKELQIDWRSALPCAASIHLISLEPLVAPLDGVTFVRGYLPVFPSLWKSPSHGRKHRPVHISNFKPMGKDQYQLDLVHLIQQGSLAVFGGRWDRAGVETRSLSLWEANRLLAASTHCCGLMYPYQRGRTLSGRMWQAPVQGCFVVSEAGTNIFGCPGILEVERFAPHTINPEIDPGCCEVLSRQAADFWSSSTLDLARSLNLSFDRTMPRSLLHLQRFRIFLWHLGFLQDQVVSRITAILVVPYGKLRGFVGRNLRRLLRDHPSVTERKGWKSPHR